MTAQKNPETKPSDPALSQEFLSPSSESGASTTFDRAANRRLVSTQPELLEACLALSAAAQEMFDRVAAGGVDAPLDDPMLFVRLTRPFDEVTGFYRRRLVGRMLALGISPEVFAERDERRAAEPSFDGRGVDG